MKNGRKSEIIIGVCVILALCFLFYGIDYLKGMNVFKPSNYYVVSYTDVKGLNVSAPVTVNGFKVGQVVSVQYEYDNPGHIKVELSLNKELKIPEGSKAVIESDMLGTASIVLKMAPNNNYHKVGSTLIGETSSGMVDNISQNLMPSVAAIFPKIDSLITALNTLVSDPALRNSVKRLDGMTAGIDETINKLNKSMNELPAIMNNVDNSTANIKTMSSDLAKLSAELNTLPVDSVFNNVNVLSQNLAEMSRELNNPNSTLGLIMKDPALYNNLNATVQSLDSLFVDIKKNPKRYISIKLL